ncbi:hypothetical protein [Phenylobacterium zucineum]|uniref:hypothetical protein n=1 Tax=Phenylobacterium zucineum TaxID=284016 RepID=UPI0002EFFDC1|nr:hypothetical protein [Phenylobacterium zucineum]
MADVPLRDPRDRESASCAMEIATLVAPFLLIAALMPVIGWIVDALFRLIG